MEFKEFLAKIKSSLKQYDSAGLINDIDVLDWVEEGLKRFGNLPTTQIEKVIEIKNGKAELPHGFKSLRAAIKCSPYTYQACPEQEDKLIDMHFYKVIHQRDVEYDSCDPCDVLKDSCIEEKVYLHTGGDPVTVYYNNPTWLKLVSYSKQDVCPSDCKNLRVKNSPYEISINKRMIYTNFTNGTVYLIYNGFEQDDDGYILIPETHTGWLETFLEYMVKRRIVEDIMSSGDATQGETTLYQMFRGEEVSAFNAAKGELKMRGINMAVNNYIRAINNKFKIYNFGL